MYCLSEKERLIFQGMSEDTLRTIAKLFNSSIENLKMVATSDGDFGLTIVNYSFCIRSHGLYELIPLITPLLIKTSLVLLVILCLQILYNLIPSGE